MDVDEPKQQMIYYQNDDILEASVTKSRPGQKIGLNLQVESVEDEFSKSDASSTSTRSSRIVVASIGGLFQQQDQDVRPGDKLLEVNGVSVKDLGNSLEDVKSLLSGAWSVNIRVGRPHGDGSSDTMPSRGSRIQVPLTALANTLENGKSEHSKLTVDSECTDHQYGSIALKCDDDDDHHHETDNKDDSEHSRDNNQKKKRRGRRKARESLGTLIQGVRSPTPSGRRGPRRGKRPTSRSKSRSHSRSKSRSRSRSKSRSQSRSKSRSRKNEGAIPKEDSGHRRSRSRSKKKKSKSKKKHKTESSKEIDVRKIQETNHKQDDKIQGVECTSAGVTLEMNNGERVSVDPMALMALMTEEDGKFVAISNQKLNCNDRSSVARTKSLPPLVSDDENEHQKPTRAPSLMDLRSLMKEKSIDDNNHSSMKTLIKDPWIRRSMATLREGEESCCDSEMNIHHGQHQPSPGSLTLRGLLGDRLRATNPKKWEESSMVSSTLHCMTNLIDPGDLMKIRNFSARPGLNGATVEIVGTSQRSIGRNRWDVRIIQRKNQKYPNLNSEQLISVAAENLRHFV